MNKIWQNICKAWLLFPILLFDRLVGKETDGFEFTILHVNDIHVRFEQTNTYGGNCKSNQECYGGISRLQYKVNEIKNAEKNVIFLNGGDFYQGNFWYTHFKWRAVAYFGNILNFTAMALGNHEFDDRVTGLSPFLENVTFPIVCANIDTANDPELNNSIPASVIIDIEGRKVGIIGYVTTETESISRPGPTLKFIDEVIAIRKEAERLKSEGIDILIALGHSGYEKDKQIALEVPDIDVVVGGHSHSFLYTTKNGVNLPSREKPRGDYPTIVTQKSGKRVPVVQAFAYTKYLGYLKVRFNRNNELKSWSGAPILLDESIPRDKMVLSKLLPWKEEVEQIGSKVVGRTEIALFKSRVKPSNLGSFITNSALHHLKSHHANLSLAMHNSGGIRGSFGVGNITIGDVYTVLPFNNVIDVLTLRGKYILQALELSVSKMSSDGRYSSGGYLQLSGFEVVYDLKNSVGKRVVSAKAFSVADNAFLSIEDEQLYKVAMPSYIADGGDMYSVFKHKNEERIVGLTPDHEILDQYIALKSPIRSVRRFGSVKIIPAISSGALKILPDAFGHYFFVILVLSIVIH